LTAQDETLDSTVAFPEITNGDIECENPLDAEEFGDEGNGVFMSTSDEGYKSPI
jgi:hypothetical protein